MVSAIINGVFGAIAGITKVVGAIAAGILSL